MICLAEGDPAGALSAVQDVLDGSAPVIGYVTVVEAHLLARLAYRELGDQRAADQAAELALALRVRPGAWPKATGQVRWGTGVWMSADRGAGAERAGPAMKVAASTAAQANAAAQIQLIWAKLDWNRTGSA